MNLALVVYYNSPRTLGSIYGLHNSLITLITSNSCWCLVRRRIFVCFISPHYTLSSKLKFSNYSINVFLPCTLTADTVLCRERFVCILKRSERACSGCAEGVRSVASFV